MWNSIQKKIVLIILVSLFIMTISGTAAAATGTNTTNCICDKNIANPIQCNAIAHPTITQNNYCQNYCQIYKPTINNNCPSPQYSYTAPTCNYSCSYNCNNVNTTNICTPNCLNTICPGYDPCSNNDPPICTPNPGNSTCDPNSNSTGGDPGDNGGAAAGDKTKVNAATVPLKETGLPIVFLVAGILVLSMGLLPKRK